MMELESGTMLHNSNSGFFSLPTFLSVDVSSLEEKGEIPKDGDISIPKAYTSPNCFIKIFILNVEKLLLEGHKILRVKVGGDMSKLISWRLCFRLNQGLK